MSDRMRTTLHCRNAGIRICFQLLDFYRTLVRRRIKKPTPRPSCSNSIAGTSAMR